MAMKFEDISDKDREAFEKIVLTRFACKRIKSDPVDPAVLKKVLALTQRAPTSFNSQPYKVVIAQSQASPTLTPPIPLYDRQ